MLLATEDFVRQYLRAPVIIVMLLVIPIMFVVLCASALSELSASLGDEVSGPAATAIGAGWAASFLGGILGYFQISSSRDADRRLALAGMGPMRVAIARIGACIAIALVVSLVAFFALWIYEGVEYPLRSLGAILASGLIYVGIGAFVGALVRDDLTGSLIVALVFVMDIYSGPGMAGAEGTAKATPTRKASEVLMDAGGGIGSPTSDWLIVTATVVGFLLIAFVAFWLSARPRT